ncbi:MAG: MarR family transcriptional regulator [Candidatus Wallbacteria bacterium]|nr:MarR family transcriptional regulator [Candidatus Wallbacteria bacterium]
MRLLWTLDHGLQRTSKQMASSLGITGPQRMVLRILGRFPGLTAGRLAHILCVHPSTLSGVLKRLQRKGLIERCADPRDRRRAQLGLTDTGRRLDMESPGTVEAAIQKTLRGLPSSRVNAAREVLTALADALDDGPKRRGASR